MLPKLYDLKEQVELNPLMQEELLTVGRDTYASISLVGGFLTRLCLAGENLLYMDDAEYRAAIPGKAHYGAPFLGPTPGVNDGYVRHGVFREKYWDVVTQTNKSITIKLHSGNQIIMQTYLLRDTGLEMIVEVKNHDPYPQEMYSFECGYHYYWQVGDQADIDFGAGLNGFPAWDNLAGRRIAAVGQEEIYAKNIDLHVFTGRDYLKFYNTRRRLSISIGHSLAQNRNTYIVYAKPDAPHCKAIECWTAPQEIEKGTWSAYARKIPAGQTLTDRFFINVRREGNPFH
jgi:galactose mutarotase-like enzyme